MKTSHLIEYSILRTLDFTAAVVPRSIALRIGGAVGLNMHKRRVYHAVVRKNLEFVGYWTRPQIEELLPKLYRNIGRYAVDVLRPVFPVPRHDLHDFSAFKDVLSRGKGLFALTGHLGGWELMVPVFAANLPEVYVVTMPMSNTLAGDWTVAKRAKAGAKTIFMAQALRKMLGVLRANGTIALLFDQFVGDQGTKVPFLGKETSTIRTIGGLAHKTECATLVGACIMKPDGTYHVEFDECRVTGIPREKTDEYVYAYQKEHNDMLSRLIVKYPDHYFGWFHRRFKDCTEY
jgi:Kdo2-lipid IVA lauroyltransferase/acyltransferase